MPNWTFTQSLDTAPKPFVNRKTTGQNYRLQIEAEWEYAAGGGNKSRNYKYSGSNNIDEVAWSGSTSSFLNKVGTKKANELGIYDISGNVAEWCEDNYVYGYNDTPTNSSAYKNERKKHRVLRGGSRSTRLEDCRVTCRSAYYPSVSFVSNNMNVHNKFGFRIVRQ